MKILIGADIVPTKSNFESFILGNIEKIVDENIEKKLMDADYRIFNLEVPLADNEEPIKKCEPNLIAPTACVKGMKKLGVNLFTLANNHIMDHGVQGLKSTIDILQKNRIDFVGVGNNLSEAQKPYIIEKEGIKKKIAWPTDFSHLVYSFSGFDIIKADGSSPFTSAKCPLSNDRSLLYILSPPPNAGLQKPAFSV